jgi:uncharacterized membrane protein YqjE
MTKPNRERDRTKVVEVEPLPDETLPELVGRLGDDVVKLVDGKLALLKVELDEAVRSYAAGAVELAIAAIVALVGFALSATALAFALVYALPEGRLDPSLGRAVAFGVIGGVSLAVGLFFTFRGKARFTKPDFGSSSTQER